MVAPPQGGALAGDLVGDGRLLATSGAEGLHYRWQAGVVIMVLILWTLWATVKHSRYALSSLLPRSTMDLGAVAG